MDGRTSSHAPVGTHRDATSSDDEPRRFTPVSPERSDTSNRLQARAQDLRTKDLRTGPSRSLE